MIEHNTFILSAFLILTTWLAAPSLLLDLVGLGSLKSPIGQALLILTFVVLVAINKVKFSRTALLLTGLVLLFGFGVMLIYSLAGLNSSVGPIFGATIKVALFIITAAICGRQSEIISKAVRAAILPILALVLLSNIVHNVIGLPELFRMVVDGRQISILFGSFSTSRLFVGDVPLYRNSAIFNEPGTYGLVLYCLFLFFVTSREFSTPNKFILALNLVTTFSLGAYLSTIVAVMAYAKPRAISTWMRRSRLVPVIALLAVVGSAHCFFGSGLSLVWSRLSTGTDGRLIAGDNRFFDDQLPQNYLLGDGSYGGGFDSVISIFQQYGILGCLILFAPIIAVAALLFLRQQFAFGLALLLFLSHKPNILVPVVLILLAVVASRLVNNRREC